jgi:hypothetical protein
MLSATRICSRLSPFGVAPACRRGRDRFSDPLSRNLQWTLCRDGWTIRRKAALRVRLRVRSTCKLALAGRAERARGQRGLFHLRLVRYRPKARAVAGRVVVPQRVTSGKPQLKSAQRRALLALESEPGASLTRSEYERLAGVGRSQAAYDLSELVSAGLFVRVGGGRSTRYVLAHEPASKRRWTPDRIRRELETFCAHRRVWPTANEFKAAGRGDLYVAASRYGGVAQWADELGLARVDRSHTAAPSPRAPLRNRLAWGLVGALAACSFAAAALAGVVAVHHFGPSSGTGAKAAAGLQSSSWIVHPWLQAPRAGATQASARHSHAVRRTHVTTHVTAQRGTLVSEPTQAASAPPPPASRGTLAATASQGNGPAPLPAPTGASAPGPLQAPGR